MSQSSPQILALDFDGVICNGIKEYFASSHQVYNNIWHPVAPVNVDELFQRFAQLRSVIETGWEMPLLIRAMLLGFADQEILTNWSNIVDNILSLAQISPKAIAQELDRVRDQWIETDLEGWLSLHQFYPGIISKIRQVISSSTSLYIVTTKESRFVSKLLGQQGINLPESAIFGKEVKRPKSETLREILRTYSVSPRSLWFVEDFLKPLELILQQADLQEVTLYLADWGYNTPKIRDYVRAHPQIHLLSLTQFVQDFTVWPSN